jgi:tetratricopeptide (TPR) repeat protein
MDDHRLAEARLLVDRGRDEEKRRDFRAALALYEEALPILESAPPSELRVDLLRWRGNAYLQIGETAEAEECYRRSLVGAKELSYGAGWAHVLNCLGAVAQRKGVPDRAEELYREAALRALQAGEHALQGMVEHNLGILANIRGDFDAALDRYRISLAAFGRCEDPVQMSHVLNDIGMAGLSRSPGRTET